MPILPYTGAGQTQGVTVPSLSVQFAFNDLTTSKVPQPFSPRSIIIQQSNGILSTSSSVILQVNTLGNIVQSLSAYPVAGTLPIISGGVQYQLNWTYANNNNLYGCYLTSGSFTPVNLVDYLVTWVWYESNTYLRDFSTKMGRQHELDRTESSTLTLSLDNRDGRWFPWNTTTFSYNATNVSGSTSFASTNILTVGVPVRVLATWNGVQYPVYFGYVNSWQPSSPDEVNSDCAVLASDILKNLSISRLSNSNLYQQELLAPLATNFYSSGGGSYNMITPELFRCNDQSSIVTGLSLQNTGPSAFIQQSVALTTTSNATILCASSNNLGTTLNNLPTTGGQFTLNHQGQSLAIRYSAYTGAAGVYTFTGCALTSGSGITLTAGDYIVGGQVKAVVKSLSATATPNLQQQGPMAYDPNCGGIALGATGTSPTYNGFIQLQNPTSIYPSTGSRFGFTMEGWFQNASVGDVLLTIYDGSGGHTASTGYQFFVAVNSSGSPEFRIDTITSSAAFTVFGSQQNIDVTDGNWHLVSMTLMQDATNGDIAFQVYVDGILACKGETAIVTGAVVPTQVLWGGTLGLISTFASPIYTPYTSATVADIAFIADLTPSNLSPTYAPLAPNRYRVGSHFKSNLAVSLVGTGPTALTPGTATTLPITNTNQFSQTGGNAVIVHPVSATTTTAYPITYSGVSFGALTGVLLNQGFTTFTPTAGTDTVFAVQTATTGSRILEALQVVGLVPDDGTWTIQSPPLNLAQGVVNNLSNESSTVYTTTALDYAFQYDDTENGFLYQDQAGVITLLNRFYPQTHWQNPIQLTDSGTNTDDAHYMLGVETYMDDLDTWEVAQLTNTAGSTTYVSDPTGTYINQYGPRTYSRGQIWASRQTDLTALGSMIVNRYKQPITRPQKVILESTYSSQSTGAYPNQVVQLSTNLWDQLVFNHDGYGTNYAQTVVVESIAHEYKAEPGYLRTTLVLSPYEMNGSSTPDSSSFFRLSASTSQVDNSVTTYGNTVLQFGVPNTLVANMAGTATPHSTGTMYISVAGVTYSATYTSVSAANGGPYGYKLLTFGGVNLSAGLVYVPSGSTISFGLYSHFSTTQTFVQNAITLTSTPSVLAVTNAQGFPSSGNFKVFTGSALVNVAYTGTNTSAPVFFQMGAAPANGVAQGCFDSSGNYYTVASTALKKITPAGAASNVVTTSTFTYPLGMAVDSSGNIYVANYGSSTSTIYKVTPGGTITTFASITGGAQNMVFDTSGNLFVADSINNNVRKITPAGAVSTFATGFTVPAGICRDSSNNLYVANAGAFTISKITTGGTVSTFLTTSFYPVAIVLDSNSIFTVTSPTVPNTFYRFALSSPSTITTGYTPRPTDGRQLAVDSNNILYALGNNPNPIIQRYLPNGQTVNTLIGVTVAGSLSLAQGDTISYNSGTVQDIFGG